MRRLDQRPRPARLALAVLLGTALLAACGGSDAAPEPSPAAAPTQEPSPSPSPTPDPVDPLTGTGPEPSTPLVAVKVDNAPLARPFHKGLDAASVVYLELVEGGATRMVALYSQPYGSEVGPVRSLRESDLELLVQFGPAAVGMSGANKGTLRSYAKVVAAGQLVDVGFDARRDLYRLAERRKDAKNFYVVPDRLAEAAAGAAPARPIGWSFGPSARPDATPAATARVVMSDRESVELQYDAASGRYSVHQAGAALKGATAANVVVQQVTVRNSGYRDVTGAVTPYSETVGEGTAHVLRDGLRYSGSWQRPGPGAGTRLVDRQGVSIDLKPGPTWVILQPAGRPLKIG